MTENPWKFVAIVVLGFFTIEHVILCSGIVALTVINPVTYPRGIEVECDPSQVVVAGEPYVVEVQVFNTGGVPRTLSMVSMERRYFNGVTVEKVEPAPSSVTDTPITDTRDFVYGLPLSPGQGESFRFHMRADGPGIRFGVMDLWFSEGLVGSAVGVPVRTTVVEKPSE